MNSMVDLSIAFVNVYQRVQFHRKNDDDDDQPWPGDKRWHPVTPGDLEEQLCPSTCGTQSNSRINRDQLEIVAPIHPLDDHHVPILPTNRTIENLKKNGKLMFFWSILRHTHMPRITAMVLFWMTLRTGLRIDVSWDGYRKLVKNPHVSRIDSKKKRRKSGVLHLLPIYGAFLSQESSCQFLVLFKSWFIPIWLVWLDINKFLQIEVFLLNNPNFSCSNTQFCWWNPKNSG